MSTILSNPDGRPVAKAEYESIEFSLANATADYDLAANQAAFKSVITTPQYCRVSTTQNISVKFNSASNHAVSLNANTNTEFDRQVFDNIYLSNSSGNPSTVRIYVK